MSNHNRKMHKSHGKALCTCRDVTVSFSRLSGRENLTLHLKYIILKLCLIYLDISWMVFHTSCNHRYLLLYAILEMLSKPFCFKQSLSISPSNYPFQSEIHFFYFICMNQLPVLYFAILVITFQTSKTASLQ